MKLILNTDGGARGNPGPAAIGVVLRNSEGTAVTEIGKYIGVGTNNEAEYKALVEGLGAAVEKGAQELECFLDSELVVKQMRGEYKIKHTGLKKLWEQAKAFESKIEKVSYSHVPREKNKEADAIVNKVLDSTN